MTGIGYTYSSPAAVVVIGEHLASAVVGCDAMMISTAWDRMVHSVRNIGPPGIAAAAISAVDNAISSDDLTGLRLLRSGKPTGMEIAAGEYGYDLRYFRHMLDADSVDVLQADATRCCGISEFMRVGALCESRGIPLSAHTAPALHLHPACAMPSVRHIEYFHDHVRVERLFFDGVTTPRDGSLAPDMTRPGLGLELKPADVERYRSM
jgi:L-alanine-DL-glutamate epimerase-like enolase superfamily enzyme